MIKIDIARRIDETQLHVVRELPQISVVKEGKRPAAARLQSSAANWLRKPWSTSQPLEHVVKPEPVRSAGASYV